MANKTEFEDKFWDTLKSDMTVMVSVDGASAHPRPLTAQLDEGERGAIYFFTAKDTDLAGQLSRQRKATVTLTSKGHDVFATVHGKLRRFDDRPTIDRLWNRFVAAWFEKGKDDPKLQLLRFDPAEAEVWLDASSLLAGVKMLLGFDPKKDYRDKVAHISMR